MDEKRQRVNLPLSDEKSPSVPPASEAPPLDPNASLEEKVLAVLKTVYDPEIPVDIYELGLVYDLQIEGDAVKIVMTLTSPACPVAGVLPGQVKERVQGIPGVGKVDVELVWEPPWDMNRMSEAARLQLGFF
jgi:FeS assembly SUF system protein